MSMNIVFDPVLGYFVSLNPGGYITGAYNADGSLAGYVNLKTGVVSPIGGVTTRGKSSGATLTQPPYTTGALSANSNWRTLISVPEHYDAVEIGFLNSALAATTTGIKVAVAPSDALVVGKGVPTTGGVRDDALWQNVTFGGNATLNLPLNHKVKGSNLFVGQQITWSDVIPCKSIARFDVPGAEPLFMVSLFLGAAPAANMGYYADALNFGTAYESLCGRICRSFTQAGSDRTSTPANWVVQTDNLSSNMLMPIIKFYWRGKVISVASYGDSTFQGIGATGTCGWMQQVFAKSGNKIVHYNGGQSGDLTSNFLGRLLDTLNEFQPTIVCWSVSTINDGSPKTATSMTAAIAAQQKAITAQVIETVSGYGGRLILCTTMPGANVTLSGTIQGIYTDLDNFALGFGQENGVYVCDIRAMHQSPGRFQTGYSDDGAHPNDTGQAVLVPLLRATANKITPVV